MGSVGGENRIASPTKSTSQNCEGIDYRDRLTGRIAQILSGGQSLMVVAEPGAGKTFLAKQIQQQFNCCMAGACDPEMAIAGFLGLETETPKGAKIAAKKLREAILSELSQSPQVLIVDEVHQWSQERKRWLRQLYQADCTLLMLGLKRDREGITYDVPKMRLEALTGEQISQLVWKQAAADGIKLAPADVRAIADGSGGNPGLALRLLREHDLGLEKSQDGVQYRDATPLLLAELSLIAAVRFWGMATNERSLYILGGLGLAAFMALRYLFRLVPKEDRRK